MNILNMLFNLPKCFSLFKWCVGDTQPSATARAGNRTLRLGTTAETAANHEIIPDGHKCP